MSSIDERVVDMRFNNQQFENGVRTSVKSLDNLKKGLDLDGAARSLSNLDRAGKSFSLTGIASGVDALSSKFSALGIMGITVLQNITNSALMAGKRMLDALTLDPIMTGFSEYETKMGAIQTILTNTASKGTTLKDVNATLNELNKYSDQTIYNFAEMAKNIGTFTAAGVDLKTSATSIKGIANLAAGSGSTSIQASTAMYQLSQAIAAGAVKLQDWNSVVNAGMGGELFQNALKKTAKEMGVFVDGSIPFRESLEKGWISTSVLTKTLAKFASDESLIKAATQVKTFTQLFDTMKESVQSGWAQSWENIIGDKDSSTALLTAISDGFGKVVGASSDARNEMLAFWNANGGRTALIQGIGNALTGLSMVLQPIEQAFRDLFPAMTGKRLVELTKGFRDLTANFKIGAQTAVDLKATFKGLFAILDIGWMSLSAIGKAMMSVLRYLIPAGNGFLSFTGNIGEFLVAIDKALKSSDAFNVCLANIGKVLKPIADGIRNTITAMVNAFTMLFTTDTKAMDAFAEKVTTRFKPFTKLGEMVVYAFTKMAEVVKNVSPTFYKFASNIGGAFDKLRENIVNALNNSDFNSILDMLNGGLFAAILLGLKKFIGSLTSLADNAGGFVGQFTGILDGVKGSLEAYQSTLKAKVLMSIAIAIGILAASLFTLSLIDSVKLTASLAAMTAMFVQLFGSMAVFQKVMSGSGFVAMGKITLAMIGLSVAILILSSAVTKLSKLDWNGIAKGLVGITGLSAILIGSSKLLEKSSGSLIRGSLGFIVFGAALLVLTSAVEKLGKLDPANLAKGLIGVGILAAELALFMKMSDLSGMGVMKGIGLLALAGALVVLAQAVKTFSEIDTGALIKGLAGIAVVLAEVGVFVKMTGNSQGVITTAIGLTILGAAMIIFSNAIINMGSMSWDAIGKGLTTMAGALAIIGVAVRLLPNNTIITGAGLVVIATSLIILSNALSNMGGMSWEGIAKGLVVLAGSLTIIAIAMAFMTTALPGAAALLVVSGALAILAPVLKSLGEMSLSEIGKGLLAIAGVFTVLGLAGLILAPLTPVILGLAGAVALFGLGCIAVGGGLLAFSAGLSALAISGAAGAAALVVIVTAMIGLIPMAAKTLAKGILDFIKVIGDGSKIIAKAVKDIVLSIIEILVEVTPPLVDGFYKIMTKVLETLATCVPKMVDAGMKIIIGFLKGIADNIGKVISTAIDVVINFIKGIASKIGSVIQAGIDLMLAFINGMADGIRNNSDKMVDAMKNLMGSIIDAGKKVLTESITGFVGIGKNIVNGLIDGMKSMVGNVANVAGELGTSVLNSAKSALGIHSPSKFFAEIGKNICAGLTNGITDNGAKAVTASSDVSKAVVKSADKVVKTSNESSKKAFDSAVAWIDDRKYYNLLSLSEELAAWERIQKRYIKGSEERTKADREVYRVKNELVKANEDIAKKTLDDSIAWIDEKKYYNQLSLTEELSAWERVQKRYLQGTDERKKADREVYRLKNDINKANEDYSKGVAATEKDTAEKRTKLLDDYYTKTKEINDKLKLDIQGVNDEYTKAVDARTNSLYNSYGLFDQVSAQDPLNGSDLIKNLKDQVVEFESWGQNIKELASKGVNDGLLKELQDMGPKALAQIKALNSLSASELDGYASLWKTKYNDAKTQAVGELESMRLETFNKIKELTSESNTQLNDYVKTWSTQMVSLNDENSKQLTVLQNDWFSKMGTLSVTTNSQVSAMKNEFVGNIATLRVDTEKEFETMAKNIQTIMTSPDWASIGANIIIGIANGIKSKAMTLSTEITNTTVEALKSAISNISNLLATNTDMMPVIRPILDLSNIESGGKSINGLFAKPQGINVGSINSKIPVIGNVNVASATSTQSGQTAQGTPISFVQNNYSPKALSRLEIYRQTKNQILTVKGMVAAV